MLRWLLGPRVEPAVQALTDEVAYLREQLADERAEKVRMLEEARDERDRRDRVHRRTTEVLQAQLSAALDRHEAVTRDFVSLADSRARAEMEHYRWARQQQQVPAEVGVPDGPGPAEGVGEEAMDRMAGLTPEENRDREPIWQHSLVAEGHVDLPDDDGEVERAAARREHLRLEQMQRERAAAGGGDG